VRQIINYTTEMVRALRALQLAFWTKTQVSVAAITRARSMLQRVRPTRQLRRAVEITN
jgi:hypothetical protein